MPPQEPINVSVVFCHHKGDLILKAIQSLRVQKYVNCEIIVVTSEDNRNFYNVKTYYVKGGPDRKRNAALKLCSYDLIAFFDDDIEATPTCVYEMVKKLDQAGIGMVFGKTLNMEHRDMFDEAGSFLTWTGFLWARGSHQRDEGQFNLCEPVLAGKSASCMIKRSVFVEAGKFDTDYEILAEETDLAWRVWLRGYQVLYVPRSVAYHAFNSRFKPPDMYNPKRIYFNGCRNYMSMLYSNLGKKNWIIPILFHTFAWTISAIGMLLTGKPRSAYWIIRGLIYFYTHAYHIWKKRVIVQGSRKISDKELLPIITRNPSLKYYVDRLFRYWKCGLHG